MSEPTLIRGSLFVDDRGTVGFVNEFDFKGIQRFYTIENHRKGFVRAWHAHQNETKFFTLLKGSALICAVKIDHWGQPGKNLPIHRFVLSELSPSVLMIPAGFANGSMTLTKDAKMLVFSSSTLQESQKDDFRFPARYWDPWNVEER